MFDLVLMDILCVQQSNGTKSNEKGGNVTSYPNRAFNPSYIKNMSALLGTDRATVMPQPA